MPYRELFQISVDQQALPLCWKTAIITPVAKKPHASENNDYRPVAIISVVMKRLEQIILHNLIQPIQEKFDIYQFAYQPNKSVQDTVLSSTHEIYQQCYARALFIDFSSAFNTIQSTLLLEKPKIL
ncbi:uncharacterized protein LOC117299158 [Asterias rubens]|uniref:uncharacterized protein LOC117299158 n=1 Tax=Asterias rubens TaxID=7604 RepID=UPI0014556867|nr:uncharacterized protein LOC117299158 [Asterias rubens]